MSNISKSKAKKNSSLDTIRNFCPPEGKTTSKKAFESRRRAKAITAAMTAKLGALNSPLKAGYKRAYLCANYLMQDGNKITSNYCKHRACNVCNRIKAAKMMHGYAKPLLSIKNIHFVTLTAPNVTGDDLKVEIDKMQLAWRRIYKNIKQKYKHLSLKGMYKLECTYNYKSKTFNPHFHLIIGTKETANEIKRQWLNQFPKAKEFGQDVRKANEKALFELFKYVTKSVVNKNYSPSAMDTIYQALQNRNTYYRIGIKKTVTEEIDNLQSQQIEFNGEKIDVWKWCNDKKDWYTSEGEAFLNTKISHKTEKLITVIDDSTLPDVKNNLTIEECFASYRKRKIEPLF